MSKSYTGGPPPHADRPGPGQNPADAYKKPIRLHGGAKYLRTMFSADGNHPRDGILVDVYCVIEAFAVTCPGLQQALKKILCCGARGTRAPRSRTSAASSTPPGVPSSETSAEEVRHLKKVPPVYPPKAGSSL